MNVGIIVHSATGHTLSVAEKIRDNLLSSGHSVSLVRVTAMSDAPQTTRGKQLRDAPDPGPYDALIFGAPVCGFSLSAVMKAYLSQLPSLDGKKAGCFVTQQFSRPWLGGNHAIRQMNALCTAKGACVFSSGIVGWSRPDRDERIAALAEKMAQTAFCADFWNKKEPKQDSRLHTQICEKRSCLLNNLL